MIEIKTVEKGAELVSILKDGFEMLHDGTTHWGRHAPILFPIVGQVKDGKTIIDGKEFHMGQHGFARDMIFETIDENSYVLRSSEETKKMYPYDFELYVSYVVKGNKVITKYKVVNKEDKEITFGIGGHPAYRCDYSSGKYRLEFEEEEENVEFYQLKNGLVKNKPEDQKKFLRENRIFLHKDIFNNDAIIIKNLVSKDIYLKTETKTILAFSFEGFKYLGVWANPGAPFVCLEPWMNTADKVDSDGIYEHKEDIIHLEANGVFEASYSVEFFN